METPTRLGPVLRTPRPTFWGLLPLTLLGLSATTGCEKNYYSNGSEAAGGTAGEACDGGAGGMATAYPGAPSADTKLDELELDLFGTIGNRFWFAVTEEQVTAMNEVATGEVGLNEDYYFPGDNGNVTYAEHLWVTSAAKKPETIDLGKVQVKLAGESTRRPWTRRTIPNLNLDTNEFKKKQRLAGYEHLRFNNAQVGSIFRERLTLEIYARMNYPAPYANYVWVSSNVWEEAVEVPYVLVERYKRHFCERWQKAFGGDCANVWEFAGDFNAGSGGGGVIPLDVAAKPGVGGDDVAVGADPSLFDEPNNCQLSSCDNGRVKALERLVNKTPLGDGYMDTLSRYIDWKSFHRFQCLSWILVTGDDSLHNQNNVVLVEGADGLFRYLPYSVDISLGQSWYPTVTLYGANALANGCQSDSACWAETVSTCEKEIAAFKKLKPVALLDELYRDLDAANMLRDGDKGRYTSLRDWLKSRIDGLSDELELYRDQPPPPLVCEDGEFDCGDGTCSVGYLCGAACAPPDNPVEGLPACMIEDVPVGKPRGAEP